MPLPFSFLNVLIGICVVGNSKMDRVSINGVDVDFEDPSPNISQPDLLARLDAMSDFVKVMVRGAEILSQNTRVAATRHLTASATLLNDINARNQALTSQVREAQEMNHVCGPSWIKPTSPLKLKATTCMS